MDGNRSRERDRGLARTAAWTRRIAVGAVLGCATLALAFAHALPGHNAAQTGTTTGTGATSSGSANGGTTAPAQPPGSGSGPGQVTSGAS